MIASFLAFLIAILSNNGVTTSGSIMLDFTHVLVDFVNVIIVVVLFVVMAVAIVFIVVDVIIIKLHVSTESTSVLLFSCVPAPMRSMLFFQNDLMMFWLHFVHNSSRF